MKKKIDVLKYKYWAFGASLLFIIVGVVFFIVFKGFNTGIDFGSGFAERVQIAPCGLAVGYSGEEQRILAIGNGNTLELQRRNSDGVEITRFYSSEYPSVNDLGKALSEMDLDVEVFDGSLETSRLVSGFGFPATLSSIKCAINFATPSQDVTIDDIREALRDVGDVKVQELGSSTDGGFQIRLKVGEGDSQREVENTVNSALGKAFGSLNYVVMQSDFVGPKFSSSLLKGSIYAILLAIFLMLVYITVRFRISYALSSIIALTHDVLMMLAFILIFRLEVSSTTIAAVLTIIGYSLNNTIVIFDRVREDIKQKTKGLDVNQIINLAVRQSFTRTLITSLTTLFAIFPLAVFSTGDIKLFAINLTWGIIVGAYSSNFIAPGFLALFNRIWPIDKIKEKEDDGYIGG